eukprot:TRINITY_DN14750_c0_g1_i1.p2 TRINITY_DN14750_c0_g1~~TRINITY_DN14750_c0_g1_i1.p2  ORF type:complete len:54 (-),score=1.17 TRINITY_DN14750_c0_g1_i1:80-241(-)
MVEFYRPIFVNVPGKRYICEKPFHSVNTKLFLIRFAPNVVEIEQIIKLYRALP